MTDPYFYESPAGSGKNDGHLPTVYVQGWNKFDNLTPAQVVAFQSFPPDLIDYAGQRRWLAEISGVTVAGVPLTTNDRDQAKIGQLKQAFDNGALTGTVAFSDAAGNTQTVDATAATAIYRGVVTFVQSTYSTYAQVKAGVSSSTITTRKQIDAAYALIAPNSPSATNPSPT